MRLTTVRPRKMRPNIVCLPSSHCVGASVMKNWLPFESGPLLAMDSIPAPDTTSHTTVNHCHLAIRSNNVPVHNIHNDRRLRIIELHWNNYLSKSSPRSQNSVPTPSQQILSPSPQAVTPFQSPIQAVFYCPSISTIKLKTSSSTN